MAKGPSTQSQTQTMEPPKFLAPYLAGVANDANSLYKNTDLPQQQFVGFSPETEQALQMKTQRATSGSPLNQAAQDQAMSTIRGDYMNSPQFMSQFQAASNRLTPQVDSAFARAGRTGSGLADVAKTQALGDSFAGLVGQERQNQLNTMQFAPQLAQQDYFDSSQLADVGAQRENLQQQQYEIDYRNQMLPWEEIGRYSGLLQGVNSGGTTTSSQPLYRNRAAGALGGAMAGASLGPMGILPGGLLGAFL